MTSPMIQKDIVTACKMEIIKAIIKELNGDYFALLVDESFNVSQKEQMAIVLQYVDRMGFVVERLVDIVHVKDTCASSLKKAIIDLLAKYSLSLSYVRGQCYDGASNMQVELNGHKMLIRKENRSSHSIHCFAYQLQLTLVAVSKKYIQVGELVVLVSNILNVLGSSFKRMDEFRESQKERIEEALDMGELKTGRGLNQELGLSRACDTRWGSHYKSFKKFILMFGSILDVLEAFVVDARLMDDEQDIANAMLLVEVANRRLQSLREDDWDLLIEKQIQELNGHFDEVTTNLLHGVACLNPIDSFSSFDIKMAKLYPDDFDEVNMGALENQLATYIIDIRDIDERFSNLNGLCDLSRKLVQTKKNLNFPLVFCSVKFALLLPVATASIERAFSAMEFIKNDMRNRMNDELLSGCLVP
uniref:Zinc finger MYM-type protein 1-like n=1 Tax=Nicotiana tabacum TaxID=4097 RepID=A0A1S4CNS4_TOBAC|nr:PREDICTED: zinc finger MYM-type protein 1-like [Nicotiana tabacum]